MATPKGAQKLAEAAGKALGTFQRLSSESDSTGVGLTSVPMPNEGTKHVTPDALKFAKAVAFFSYVKAGAILSAQTGVGFIIKKNYKAGSSEPVWSAPLFFSETGMGLGATVGFEQVDSLLLLLDEEGLEDFKEGGLTSKTNFRVHADFNKFAGSKDAQPVRAELDRDIRPLNAVPYYVQTGVMMDFSTSSAYMKVSKSANEAAYGAGVTYADILDGTVPQPEQCAALYKALNDCIAKSV